MRKILLLGANGQVGTELRRALSPLGIVHAYTRATADLANVNAIIALVRQLVPDVIVNAAAYTAVDNAETDQAAARRINAETVAALAAEAKRAGAWLIHYSTDYVFDGAKATSYLEDDATAPVNIYGATKRAGEQAIADSGCKHLVFRTSWIYATHGRNFLKTILGAAATHNELQVVNDQVSAPTSAELVADVTALCLYRVLTEPAFAEKVNGLYHLTAAGEISWHGYAIYAVQTAMAMGWPLKIAPESIKPVPSSQYPTPAKRPLRSTLDTKKLQKIFGLTMPDWRLGVARAIIALPRP